MPESVIVDDGGSTRIRWVKDGIHGKMDDLLKVIDLGGPRKGSKHVITRAFTNVLIVYLNAAGISKNITRVVSKDVRIASDLDQNVLLDTSGSQLQITAFSDVTAPSVDSTQHHNKFSYVVRNAGTIEKIIVDGKAVYDTTTGGGSTEPSETDKPVLHTIVILS